MTEIKLIRLILPHFYFLRHIVEYYTIFIEEKIMPFNFKKTEIEGLVLIEPKIFEDGRGYFFENFKKSDFLKNGIDIDFVQENCSKSSKGVLRGLHFQRAPYAQGKIITCTKGEIIDCAVDLRVKSKTFKKYLLFRLNDKNKHSLFIPKGFAHGFLTLSDTAEISYKISGAEYNKESEYGIIYNDPELNIDWNLDFEPILSDKDKISPKLSELKEGDLF